VAGQALPPARFRGGAPATAAIPDGSLISSRAQSANAPAWGAGTEPGEDQGPPRETGSGEGTRPTPSMAAPIRPNTSGSRTTSSATRGPPRTPARPCPRATRRGSARVRARARRGATGRAARRSRMRQRGRCARPGAWDRYRRPPGCPAGTAPAGRRGRPRPVPATSARTDPIRGYPGPASLPGSHGRPACRAAAISAPGTDAATVRSPKAGLVRRPRPALAEEFLHGQRQPLPVRHRIDHKHVGNSSNHPDYSVPGYVTGLLSCAHAATDAGTHLIVGTVPRGTVCGST
jgi:hypothetical protein